MRRSHLPRVGQEPTPVWIAPPSAVLASSLADACHDRLSSRVTENKVLHPTFSVPSIHQAIPHCRAKLGQEKIILQTVQLLVISGTRVIFC